MTRDKMTPEERRDRLIEAAIPLFADRGLDGVTQGEVAKASGITQGLISYYFGGSQGLYGEAYLRAMHQVGRFLVDLPPVPRVGDPDAELLATVALKAYVRGMLGTVIGADARGRACVRLMLREFSATHEWMEGLIWPYLGNHVRYVHACVKILRPDWTQRQVSLFGSAFFGAMFWPSTAETLNLRLRGEHYSADEVAEFLFQFAGLGLYPQDPNPLGGLVGGK